MSDGFPDKIDALWINVHLARMTTDQAYGAIKNGALAVVDDKIAWVGHERDLPSRNRIGNAAVYDGRGGWITPGLVDCHTHLIYGGSRAREFELRLKGATYEEIARLGGGIRSTVAATRDASMEDLFQKSAERLHGFLKEGVTSIEIKSGYGLDMETEVRMLKTARMLAREYPVTVHPTYLGAHALPPEYEGKSDAYIDFVCREVIPNLAENHLLEAVDAFCDTIGFTYRQTEQVFQAAERHGLPVKLHAEQLSNQNGASLAARYKALSADHLEYLTEAGVAAMAEAGVTAVLLPGAFYYLRNTQKPPIRIMRDHHLPMAVASDHNPGSCPTGSLLLMLNMACIFFSLTPEEALAGVTRNAARALGRADRIGTLEPGKDADFVLWDITNPAELSYRFGWNPVKMVVQAGKVRINRVEL